MEKKFLRNLSGFTLIELMVVVAIIGVLSAIAVPNFKKYQAKAKQSEAKIQLAAVYSVEVGSMADYDAYATCLVLLGYDVSPRGYYYVGFNAPYYTAVNARFSACDATSPNGWAPISQLKSGGTIGAAADTIAASVATATTFKAEAVGNISAALKDHWYITETKDLSNTPGGY